MIFTREEGRGIGSSILFLGEIYGRFTEGFDVTDLREARALLEELNP